METLKLQESGAHDDKIVMGYCSEDGMLDCSIFPMLDLKSDHT